MDSREQVETAEATSGNSILLVILIYIEKMKKSLLSMYDLSGYIAYGDPILREIDGKNYSVQYYQGKHENEYTIMEMKDGIADGKAQLFQYGILKLAWTMKQGKRSGVLTIYNEGKVEKEVLWDNFEKNATEERVVWNGNNKQKTLTITDVKTGKRIYKGECNEHLERHGFGIAYHNETGYPQYSGYFVDDVLFHISQQVLAYTPNNSTDSANDNPSKSTSTTNHSPKYSFTTSDLVPLGNGRMVEYGGKSTESNTELIKALPIYIGECVHCEESAMLLRHGRGKDINMYTGICENESNWTNGVRGLIVEYQFDGWNCKCDAATSLRIELDGRKKKSQSELNPNTISLKDLTFSFGGNGSNPTTTTSTKTNGFSFGGNGSNPTTTSTSTTRFDFQTYQKAFGFTKKND